MKNDLNVDRRILKSKQAIRKALVKILSEKNLDDVTITEIAKEADINRKTFYNYYSTPYQVIEEIEIDIVNSFNEILLNISIEDFKYPIKIFKALNNIIQYDFEFYSSLVKAQKIGEINLISRISESLKQRIKQNISKDLFKNQFTMELSLQYAITGMLEVYKEWLINPKSISLDKLSETLSMIMFSGLNSVMTVGDS